MRRFIIVLPLLIAAPLIAQNPPPAVPGSMNANRITAGNYVTDPSHTLVEWSVNHFGFNDYFGLFGSPTGTLALDPAKPNKSVVMIDIPMSGLITANEKLNAHMNSADFLDTAKFTTAKFVSTSVVSAGNTAKIRGNLTLKGVTKPVLLNATFSGAGTNPYSKKETVGFHATAAIKRSDWGISYGVPMVSDAVALKITVAFEKAS